MAFSYPNLLNTPWSQHVWITEFLLHIVLQPWLLCFYLWEFYL